MYTNSILAMSGALLPLVAAVPFANQHHQHHHEARDFVWHTVTDIVYETVAVTKTVWDEPGETAPAYQHPKPSAHSSQDVSPSAYTPASSSSPAAPAYTPETSSTSEYVAPAPTTPSSSSIYVAPTISSTSVYVAPTTSTSVYVAPTPTSTYVAPTTTEASSTYQAPSSTAAASSATSSASSYSGSSSGVSGLTYGLAKAGTSYTGDLTWYDVGLGACGWTNTTSQPIVAISESIFDSYNNGNPNANPLCGKWVTITGVSGNPFSAQIVDRCPGCDQASLDLSEDFFNSVTEYGDGRVKGIKWSFQ